MSKILAVYKDRLEEWNGSQGLIVLDESLDKLLKQKFLSFIDERLLENPEVANLWVPLYTHTIILNQFNYILTYARLESDGVSGFRTVGSYEPVLNQYPLAITSYSLLNSSINHDLEMRLGQPKYRYDILEEIQPRLVLTRNTDGIASCSYVRCAKMTGKLSILNSRRLLHPKFSTISEISEELNVYDDASQLLMLIIQDILTPLTLPTFSNVNI